MKKSHIIIAIIALVAAYFLFFKKKKVEETPPAEVPAPLIRVVSTGSKVGRVPLPSGATSKVFTDRQDAVAYYNARSGCRFIELVGGGFEVQC